MASIQKLSRDLKLLLGLSSLHKISTLFFGTFLVSYIMHNSVNEIVAVSAYWLFCYIALGVGFFIMADWVKRKNKVMVFALSTIPKIILLLGVIFFHDAIIEHIIPMGLLYGFYVALYWLPMHTMVGEKVDANTMTKFTGYKSTITGATKIIAPVVLGMFITVGSYEQMAVVVLVLSIFELIMMFRLKPSLHRTKKKVDLVGFFQCMMRFPIIRKLFSIEMLRGFSTSGLLGTVITMYTVYMFKTDLKLGIFTTVFAIFSIIASFLFGRFGKKKFFPRILFMSSLAALCSLTLFLFHTNEITFLVYNFVYVTAISLLEQIAEINMYNLAKSKCVTSNHKIEYFVFREAALVTGRVFGYVLLMYIGVFGGYEWLRYLLIVLTVAILLIGFWSMRINKFIKG